MTQKCLGGKEAIYLERRVVCRLLYANGWTPIRLELYIVGSESNFLFFVNKTVCCHAKRWVGSKADEASSYICTMLRSWNSNVAFCRIALSPSR